MDLDSLSQLGVGGMLVVAIVFIIRDFLKYIKEYEKRSEKRENSLRKVIKKNTDMTQEVYKYLKLRNGSLEKKIQNLARAINEFKK